ncbi:MAG: phosphotransferase enzyme family protein [Pseudomonadales bacterium]
MSEFYELGPERQAECYRQLAQRALQQWGIENAGLELLKQRENAVFAVTTGVGNKYALRIHRADYHTDAELRSELQWMAALDAYGVHTPAVVPALDGKLFERVSVPEVPESRQVDLLAWIDGKPMGSIEAGMQGELEELLANYRLIGELAAKLHNQTSNWDFPEGFTRHHWDADGLVGDKPFWGRFWENAALTAEQRALIVRARDVVREKLLEFGTGEDRYGLIHADFLPENLMVSDTDVKLIDFDDAGFGWHLFELATSLFVHLGEPHFDAVSEALFEGYRSQRALPDEHLKYLPYLIMARLFTYLGWLHTRETTDTTVEMTPVIVAAATGFAEHLLGEEG